MSLRFIKKDGTIRILWKNFMYADIPQHLFYSILKKYGEAAEEKNEIIPKIPENLYFLFLQDIYEVAKNKFVSLICRRKTFYIHDIPITGYNAFGIIDRGTNLLQVRPVTGCNLNCIYCSVDEGPYSKSRKVDYVVAKDLIVDEFKRIARIKKHPVEAHIDGQGEPLLYPDIADVISELRDVSNVKVISMQSNGLLLNDKVIEGLASAGLSRINISLNSFRNDVASFMAGVENYGVERILELIDVLLNSGIKVLLAPLILPGVNDCEIPQFIKFAREKLLPSEFPVLGIQKYIPHRFGRKVKTRVQRFYEFYNMLREYERIYKFKPLVLRAAHFGITYDCTLPKKFKRGEKISAKIALLGRMENERIAVARDSLIQVINCQADIGDRVSLRIRSTSHGVYVAECV